MPALFYFHGAGSDEVQFSLLTMKKCSLSFLQQQPPHLFGGFEQSTSSSSAAPKVVPLPDFTAELQLNEHFLQPRAKKWSYAKKGTNAANPQFGFRVTSSRRTSFATPSSEMAKSRTSFALWPGATAQEELMYSGGARNRSESSTGLLPGMNRWESEADDRNRVGHAAKHLAPGPETCAYVKKKDYEWNPLRAEALKTEMLDNGAQCVPGSYKCCLKNKQYARADPTLFKEGQFVAIRSELGEDPGDGLYARVKRFEPISQGWVIEPFRPRRGGMAPKDELNTLYSVQPRCKRTASSDEFDAMDYKDFNMNMEPVGLEANMPKRCKGQDEKAYKCEQWNKDCRALPTELTTAERAAVEENGPDVEIDYSIDENVEPEMEDPNRIDPTTPGLTCRQRLEHCQYDMMFHATNRNEQGWSRQLGEKGRAHDAQSRRKLLAVATDKYFEEFPDPKGFWAHQFVEIIPPGESPGEGKKGYIYGFNNETGKWKIRLFGNPALLNKAAGEKHEVEQARFDEDTGSRLQPFTGLYMRCHGMKFGSTMDAIMGTIPDDDGPYFPSGSTWYGKHGEVANNAAGWWPEPITSADDLPRDCHSGKYLGEEHPMWSEYSSVPINSPSIDNSYYKHSGGFFSSGSGGWKNFQYPMRDEFSSDWVHKTNKQRKDMDVGWIKRDLQNALNGVAHHYAREIDFKLDQHVTAEKYAGEIVGAFARKVPMELWADTKMVDTMHYRPPPLGDLTLPSSSLRPFSGIRVSCGLEGEWGDKQTIVTSWRTTPEICKTMYVWPMQLWGNNDDETNIGQLPLAWREQKATRNFVEAGVRNQETAWPAIIMPVVIETAMDEVECSKRCCGHKGCKSFSYLKNKTRTKNCILFRDIQGPVNSTDATNIGFQKCGGGLVKETGCKQMQTFCATLKGDGPNPFMQSGQLSPPDPSSPLTNTVEQQYLADSKAQCMPCPNRKNRQTCTKLMHEYIDNGYFDGIQDSVLRDRLISETSANCRLNCVFDFRSWKTCKMDLQDATYEKDPLPVVWASLRYRIREKHSRRKKCGGYEWWWDWTNVGRWEPYRPVRTGADLSAAKFSGGKEGELLFPRPTKKLMADMKMEIRDGKGRRIPVPNYNPWAMWFTPNHFNYLQDVGAVLRVLDKGHRYAREMNPDRGVFKNAIVTMRHHPLHAKFGHRMRHDALGNETAESKTLKKAKVLLWDPVKEEAVLEEVKNGHIHFRQKPEKHFIAPRALENFHCAGGVRVQTRLHEIKTVSAARKEDCAVACDTQTNCQSFDFFKGQYNWRTSHEQNCHLYGKNSHLKEILDRDRVGLRHVKKQMGGLSSGIDMELEKVLPKIGEPGYDEEWSKIGVPPMEKPYEFEDRVIIFQLDGCEIWPRSCAREAISEREIAFYNSWLKPKSAHAGTGATRGLNGAKDRWWCRQGRGTLVKERCSTQELGRPRYNPPGLTVPEEGQYTETPIEQKGSYQFGTRGNGFLFNEDSPSYWTHCNRAFGGGTVNPVAASATINNTEMAELCRNVMTRPTAKMGFDVCQSQCVFELQGQSKETGLIDGAKSEQPGGIGQDAQCRQECLDHVVTPWKEKWDQLSPEVQSRLQRENYIESPEGDNTGHVMNPGTVGMMPYLNHKCNAIYDWYCRPFAPGRSFWEKGNFWWNFFGRWPLTNDSYECMDLHDPIRFEPDPIDPSCCGGEWSEPYEHGHGTYHFCAPMPKLFCNQFYRTDMAFGRKHGQAAEEFDKENDPKVTSPTLAHPPEHTNATKHFSDFNMARKRGRCKFPAKGYSGDVFYPRGTIRNTTWKKDGCFFNKKIEEKEDAVFDYGRLETGGWGFGARHYGGQPRWFPNCRMPIVLVGKHLGVTEASSGELAPMAPSCRVHIASKRLSDRGLSAEENYFNNSDVRARLNDETNQDTSIMGNTTNY